MASTTEAAARSSSASKFGLTGMLYHAGVETTVVASRRSPLDGGWVKRFSGSARQVELAEGASETHKCYVWTHEVCSKLEAVSVSRQHPSLVLAARPDQDASSVLGGGNVTGGDPAPVGKV